MNPEEQIVATDAVPFGRLLQAFSDAQKACPDSVKELDISSSGFRIRVRIVGTELSSSIEKAFGHLVSPRAGEPDLTIQVWDAAETGISAEGEFGADRELDDVDILLKISEDGRYLCEQRDQAVSWLDSKSSRIVACAASADCQYLDERARPFHKLISAWLNDRGVQFVHAGLIGIGETGFLFVGNGGAGKSTSSVACLRSGMSYLGDDFVGLEYDGGQYQGHSLFASALLGVHHLKRFPDLRERAVPAYHEFEEKSIIYLDDVFPGSLTDSIPVKAIVLPRVVDSETTTYRSASKAEALFAIAPTSVMFLPRPSQTAFDRLAEMVERVPAYWLQLGRDIDGIPVAVKELASEVSGER